MHSRLSIHTEVSQATSITAIMHSLLSVPCMRSTIHNSSYTHVVCHSISLPCLNVSLSLSLSLTRALQSLRRRQSHNHTHTSLHPRMKYTHPPTHTSSHTHIACHSISLTLTHITVPLSLTHTFESLSPRQSQQSFTHRYRHRRAHKTSYSQTPTSRTFLVFSPSIFPSIFFASKIKANPRARQPQLADADLTHFPGEFFFPQTTFSQKSSHY